MNCICLRQEVDLHHDIESELRKQRVAAWNTFDDNKVTCIMGAGLFKGSRGKAGRDGESDGTENGERITSNHVQFSR